MPHSDTYLKATKGETLLELFADDGASPAGEAPPAKYLQAVKQAERAEDVRAVGKAHREGNDPPGLGGSPPGQSP